MSRADRQSGRSVGGVAAAVLGGTAVALLLLTGAGLLSAILVGRYVQEGCFLDCGDVWTVRGIAMVYVAAALVTLGVVALIVAVVAKRSPRRSEYVIIALLPALMLATLGYVMLSDASVESTRLAWPPMRGCTKLYGDCLTHDIVRVTAPELAPHSCDESESLRPLADDKQTVIYFKNETDKALTLEWMGYDSRQTTARVEPGDTWTQLTFATHPWLVSADGACRAIFIAEAEDGRARVR